MSAPCSIQTSREAPRPQAGPRVLFLAKVYPYPPATAGDAVYSRGLIEALSETCCLTVLCSDSGAEDRHHSEIDWHITGRRRTGRAGSVLSRWPLIAWTGAQRDYHAELKTLLLAEWDAIVLDNLGTAHALPAAEHYRAEHSSTKLVYISHEHEYPTRAAKYTSYKLSPPKRILAGIDLAKVRRAEALLLRRCDIVTVINHADVEPFRRIAPERKYLPILPGYDGPVVSTRRIDARTPRRVLVLGGRRSEQKQRILLDWMEIAYEPFCRAGLEMVVVGDMANDLQAYLRETYPNAQVLGFVDDLDSLFASARLGIIADTTGGGFKLRLLTQVFQRLPIVGLRSAIDGLATPEGRGYLGASDLNALVDLVRNVVDDTDRLNALHMAAFEDCADCFMWSARAQAFKRALLGNRGVLV